MSNEPSIKKYSKALYNTWGEFISEEEETNNGYVQYWKFPDFITTEDVYLALDQSSDSYFEDFEVTSQFEFDSQKFTIKFIYVDS
jgi:hypothetical protein